jgi:hypothetical protein
MTTPATPESRIAKADRRSRCRFSFRNGKSRRTASSTGIEALSEIANIPAMIVPKTKIRPIVLASPRTVPRIANISAMIAKVASSRGGGRIRTCDLRVMSPRQGSRWTTWGTVSSGLRESEISWDRLGSVGYVAPASRHRRSGLRKRLRPCELRGRRRLRGRDLHHVPGRPRGDCIPTRHLRSTCSIPAGRFGMPP